MISLEPVFYDNILIKIDYWIFGVNPTQYLYQYRSRFLTEFMQIMYTLFYLMPIIFGMELYLLKRYKEFKNAMFVIFFGFYLSFFGYLIIPAIGPRFTLHNFANLNSELPGLYLTNMIRDFVNMGESIPKNTLNPEAVAQRDAFPSGHTELILLIVYLSYKAKSKSFYFYLPYALLMIFSTIYLRYHYVIDIIGGALFATATVLITNWIENRKSHIASLFNKKE
jgi:membrane-associated phospholipid phosphatase